jgi:hypothetical protein
MKMNVKMRTNTGITMNVNVKLDIKMKQNTGMNIKMGMNLKLQMGMRCCQFACYSDGQIKAATDDRAPLRDHTEDLPVG